MKVIDYNGDGKIGFTIEELGEIPGTSKRMARFRNYLVVAAQNIGHRATERH